MRREDIEDVLGRIPTDQLSQVVFNLSAGGQLTLDVVLRYEEEYFLIRGREGGTTDEGRAFFVPYSIVTYIKFDRVTKLGDLKRMYGEEAELDFEERLAAEEAAAAKEKADAASAAAVAPAAAADPASIAKQNLLERIRAARTSAGGGSAGGSLPPKRK